MDQHADDLRYLRIGVTTRLGDPPSEFGIRQSLQTTFMTLGGITRAGTEFETLGKVSKTSDAEKQYEL